MKKKLTAITVAEANIRIIKYRDEDYLCLTDMVKNYGGDVNL